MLMTPETNCVFFFFRITTYSTDGKGSIKNSILRKLFRLQLPPVDLETDERMSQIFNLQRLPVGDFRKGPW